MCLAIKKLFLKGYLLILIYHLFMNKLRTFVKDLEKETHKKKIFYNF